MYHAKDFPPGGDDKRARRMRRLIALFDRNQIEAAIEGLLAYLDARGGDADMEDDERAAIIVGEPARDRDYADEPLPGPDGLPGDLVDAEDGGDTEANGDELGDHNGAEDDFVCHDHDGPGCPIADPDYSVDDVRNDPSWTEWHGRGRHKLTAHGGEIICGHESDDAEEDDPLEQDDEPEEDDHAGGNVTDEPHDGECEFGADPASATARRPHRDRIRATRCERIAYPVNRWTGRAHVEYRLRNGGGARMTIGSAL